MKTFTFTAAALLAFGAATLTPAFAEGNRPAFDVGSAQYPNVVGRPGTNLVGLGDNQVLLTESNEAPVQTANSLPRNFEAGTADYTQAQSMNRWTVAHNQPSETVAFR